MPSLLKGHCILFFQEMAQGTFTENKLTNKEAWYQYGQALAMHAY